MADEENKNQGQQPKTANTGSSSQNAGNSSNSNKKRRRKPRKRKPNDLNSNSSANSNPNSSNKKRTRHRPKQRKHPEHKSQQQPAQEEEEFNLNEVPDENPAEQAEAITLSEEPSKEPSEDESGFDLTNIDDTPLEEVDKPEQETNAEPEEPAPAEELVDDSEPKIESGDSSLVPPMENVEGPTDWNQLKEAIKQDHVETNKKIKKQPEEGIPGEVVPGAIQPEEEPVKPSAKEEKPSAGEVISPSDLADDEAERKEVIQIVTRYAIGGCLIIALISAIFFFRLPQMAFEGISGLFSGDEKQNEEVIQDKNTSNDQNQTGKSNELESTFVAGDNQGTSRDKFEEGVETALVSGDDSPTYEGSPDAIKTLYLTGLEVTSPAYSDRISSYMATLLKLQNAFATDIHQLLDNAKDREEALNVHLNELREVYTDALDVQRQINEEKDKLKVQFNEITTQKDVLEKDFFVSLDKLEGNKSNDLLNSFIESSKRQIELKAEYNALNKVADLFTTALGNMDARIKDIELNKKALIQGVQVVDIKGSDLDLIIQEGALF